MNLCVQYRGVRLVHCQGHRDSSKQESDSFTAPLRDIRLAPPRFTALRRRGGQRSPLVPVAPRGPAGATAPGLLTCGERASGTQIMQPPAGGAGRRAAGQASGLAKRLCLAGVVTAREVARRSICAARPASEIPRAGRGGQVTRRRPPQERRARGSGRGQSGVGNRRTRAAVRCP